jgi:hypothetical protein
LSRLEAEATRKQVPNETTKDGCKHGITHVHYEGSERNKYNNGRTTLIYKYLSEIYNGAIITVDAKATGTARSLAFKACSKVRHGGDTET